MVLLKLSHKEPSKKLTHKRLTVMFGKALNVPMVARKCLLEVFTIIYTILEISMFMSPPPHRLFLRLKLEKLFYLGPLNWVCGYIWRVLTSSSNLSLGIQLIGHWKSLRGLILGLLTYSDPVLEYRRADSLKVDIHNAYICPLWQGIKSISSRSCLTFEHKA